MPRRDALRRATTGWLVVAGLTVAACSGGSGSAVGVTSQAPASPQVSPPPTQLAQHKQLLLEDEPASCSVSLELDDTNGLVHADIALTVVGPDGIRSARYEFESQARSLEGSVPLRLGVGESEAEASIMYELEPDAGRLWADVMADRATLTFTRVAGTPEERLGGW